MFRWILICVVLALPVQAQTLSPAPMTSSPWDDYTRAAEVFNEGDRLRAGCILYRGQFRARLLLMIRPGRSDQAQALFASLQETVARPINEWLAGDRDDWISAMTCARTWAATGQDPDFPRTRHAAAYAEVLAGLDGLIASIPSAAELRATRRANGLPNR
ncbi:hypothetical protein [Gymnodinialimonas ulvae]|uniref:hypothetical protein n=1 Tax=Gymnodinialimonas ulvae TaxID=3126504 RepID=UPI0030A0458D